MFERVERENREVVFDYDAQIGGPRLSERGQALAATQGQESEVALPPVQGIQHTKSEATLAATQGNRPRLRGRRRVPVLALAATQGNRPRLRERRRGPVLALAATQGNE